MVATVNCIVIKRKIVFYIWCYSIVIRHINRFILSFSCFSIYSSPKQPISSLRTTIEDRLYASLPSFETLPDTLPHATFQPNDFSPIPWPHPPLASYAKTREEASSSFFPTDSSAYSQTGSTGLSSRIFDGKEN